MKDKRLQALHGFKPLKFPTEIKQRAEVYSEAKSLIERPEKDVIRERLQKEEMIVNAYDKGVTTVLMCGLGAGVIGLFSIFFHGDALFWIGSSIASFGASKLLDSLACRRYRQELNIIREAAHEDMSNKLNSYTFLLRQATAYINAQTELWNHRLYALQQNLSEATNADFAQYEKLKLAREDFSQRIRCLVHLHRLEMLENRLKSEGVDIKRFHGLLKEHLKELKPIVPEIANDPLMIEAIRDVDELMRQSAEPDTIEDQADCQPADEDEADES